MDSIRHYMKFVKPYFWHIVATVIIGILKFAYSVIVPLILKYFIHTDNQGDNAPAEKPSNLFLFFGISFLVFLIFPPPNENYRQYLAQYVASKILYNIRDSIFDHLQRL